jgi:hypothetical protein
MRNASSILVTKSVEKTPFRRSKRRWKNNINQILKKHDMRVSVRLIWLKARGQWRVLVKRDERVKLVITKVTVFWDHS